MSMYPEQIHRLTTASMLREWREHGGKYRLEGSRCAECDEIFFPRRQVCGSCNSLKLVPYSCARSGKIEVMIRWDNPGLVANGYGETVPRYLAMIRLDDGLVIASEIVDVGDPDQLQTGTPVRMVIRKHVRESNLAWQYAYKFVVAS
jgi:2-acetylphloroglucinol acetyltransferase